MRDACQNGLVEPACWFGKHQLAGDWAGWHPVGRWHAFVLVAVVIIAGWARFDHITEVGIRFDDESSYVNEARLWHRCAELLIDPQARHAVRQHDMKPEPDGQSKPVNWLGQSRTFDPNAIVSIIRSRIAWPIGWPCEEVDTVVGVPIFHSCHGANVPMGEENKIEKVIIIGSGPAGWTAAIYAARANLQPLVFAGRPKSVPTTILPGGQLMMTTEVENYPGFPKGVTGPILMSYFEQQAAGFGTRIVTDKGMNPDVSDPDDGHSYAYQDCKRIDVSSRPFLVVGEDDTEYRAHSLIIATGATANWIGLENEKRLAMAGGGVSACAVCDGALPVFRDKVLAVVGGGDSAVEEATYLTKFASKVNLIHRRDQLRASKIMAQRAIDNPKIDICWNKVVTDVLGDAMITGIRLKDTRTDEETTMEVGGLFAAIGHTPATEFLEGQLELDEKRYVKLQDPYRSTTSVEGVFAAGDVSDSVYRQAVTAAGMGCKAAIDAERWLAEEGIE